MFSSFLLLIENQLSGFILELFRVWRIESTMGFSDVRYLDMFGMLGEAPGSWGPFEFRSIDDHG